MKVPITPDVLRWAVDESGFTTAEVCEAAGVTLVDYDRWITHDDQPTLTQLRKLATKLHRQVALFLLPGVPEHRHPPVDFRHPRGQVGRSLNPVERRFLRRARRLQEAQAWLGLELERESVTLPATSVDSSAEESGALIRSRLAVALEDQVQWSNASVAFDAWRGAVEHLGVTVVLYSMGTESCQGFSLWDNMSPLVAINTAWRDEARIYTLFHELGHLITRTNSACPSGAAAGDSRDPAERWCEEFAAAVLLPPGALTSVGRVAEIPVVASLARRYKVSLRAMAIRLIASGRSTWALYRAIPPTSDAKRQGGGGGTGRNRLEIRVDEMGRRGTEIFVAAVERDVISTSQALDYLDVPVADFDRLRLSTPASL